MEIQKIQKTLNKIISIHLHLSLRHTSLKLTSAEKHVYAVYVYLINLKREDVLDNLQMSVR